MFLCFCVKHRQLIQHRYTAVRLSCWNSQPSRPANFLILYIIRWIYTHKYGFVTNQLHQYSNDKCTVALMWFWPCIFVMYLMCSWKRVFRFRLVWPTYERLLVHVSTAFLIAILTEQPYCSSHITTLCVPLNTVAPRGWVRNVVETCSSDTVY